MINFYLFIGCIALFISNVGFVILYLLAKSNHNMLVDIYNELSEIHSRHNPNTKFHKVEKL